MRFLDRERRRPTIIVVALIDVLCILLIFQMVTMTFRDTAAVQLRLPESKTAQEAEKRGADEHLILTISKEEKLYLNEEEMPLNQLLGKLIVARKRNPQVALELRADERVSFGFIIKVMDIAKEAEIPAVSAFVRRPAG